jgi:hypothetical protein
MKVKALIVLTLALTTLTGGCSRKDAGTQTANINGNANANRPNTPSTPMPTATPAADDTKLTGMITENLNKAGCEGAKVSVVGGKPTVTGEVPAAKYATCIQVIQQAGVSGGVDNQLKKGK